MAPIRKPLQSTSPQPTLYVETLGGFRVHLHKRRLPGQGRASGRPLQLLALLIAMGGHEVPMVRLQEALWPESDGDRAHRAFATTLHRLRRLVGQETLRLRDGRLSLSSQRCRVDAFDFTALEETAALERLEAGLERYRGDFLEDMWELPAVLAMRERLRVLFLSLSDATARLHEEAGRIDEALAICERALAIAPNCEPIARRRMGCLRRAGRLGEALEAHRRLRLALAEDELTPTAESEALLRELLDEREARVVAPEPPSLSVCPFSSLAGDASLNWVAAGFTENLTAALACLPRLTLIGSPADVAEPPSRSRARELGLELGVRYLLTGTVQADHSRLRVTAQLVEAATGRHVWAERFDGVMSDAVAVQDEIVERILVALQVQLTEGEQARTLWRGTTSNLQAWELAIRGLERFRSFTRGSNEEARRLWQAALDLDPTYVMALVPLGWTYLADARSGRAADSEAAVHEAECFAKRALRQDPGSGPARVLLGHVRLLQLRHDEAEALMRRAAELNPGGADTVVIVGTGLASCGKADEAQHWIRRAMQLAPCCPDWYLGLLARAQYITGEYAQAMRTLMQSPSYCRRVDGQALLAAGLVALGRRDAAIDAVQHLLRLDPDFTIERRLRWYFPLRNPQDRERLEGHLRAAGCP